MERGYGWTDLERSQTTEEDALLRLASVTKPMTAAAIRKLVNEGQLALNNRVFCLTGNNSNCILNIPPQGTPDGKLKDITIEHLLNHRGGWIEKYLEIQCSKPSDFERPRGSFTSFSIRHRSLGHRKPLDFAPGEKEAYSNFGFLLLGLIVERITGMDYVQYLRQAILAPLGISSRRCQARSVPSCEPGRTRATVCVERILDECFQSKSKQPAELTAASTWNRWKRMED